jgi:hypothetical protein
MAGEQLAMGQQYLATETQDRDAAYALGKTTDAKLADMVYNNPDIAKQPTLLSGFAQTNDLNGNQVANAVKFMTAYHGIGEFVKGAAQQSFNWGTFLHKITNTAHDAWNGVSNFLDNAPGELLRAGENVGNRVLTSEEKMYKQGGIGGLLSGNLNAFENFKINVDKGAVQAGKDLLTTAEKVSNFARTMETGGIVNQQGKVSLNPADITNNAKIVGLDLDHTVRSVADMVDPWSKNNAYMMMSHTIAFYESMAARYGWAHALGYALPSIVAGLATDGATTAESIATTEAEDLALIQRLNFQIEQAQEAGQTFNTATGEDNIAAMEKELNEAVRRVRTRAESQKALYNRAMARAARSDAYRAAEKGFEFVSRPFSPIIKAARLLGRPVSSLKYNTMYLTSQEGVENSNDPSVKDIWNNEWVQKGVAIDINGKPVGTDGQMIAQYFGFDKNNMFFSPVSGFTDFYTKWLGSDPLAAYGETLAKAREFDGFTGKLGAWFGGLGIRNADDVTRANEQYSRVNRAVKFMAEHNAAEILDAFRNTFQDDANRGIEASSLVKKIGDASTEEEVLQILRDVATSSSLIKSTMPTMTLYEVLKAGLKGNLGERFRVVGDLLDADSRYLENISKLVKDQTGIDVKPDDALLYVYPDSTIRGLSFFARWLSTRFTRDPMYIDKLLMKVENSTFRPGNVDAIPAVMDLLRASLMPENVVKGVGDMLLHSENPQDYINAYRHAIYHAVMRRATIGMKKPELSIFLSTASDHVWGEVIKLTGVDGGGVRGLYVAGEDGYDASRVFDEKTGQARFAGIGTTHLGELRFPRVAELKGLAKRMNGFSAIMYQTNKGQELSARLLNPEALERLARFTKSTLHGAPESIKDIADKNLSEMLSGPMRDGYKDAHEEIQNKLQFFMSNKDNPDSVSFVSAYDNLRNEASSIQYGMNGVQEQLVEAKFYQSMVSSFVASASGPVKIVSNADIDKMVNTLEKIKGMKTAYEDAIAQLEHRVKKAPYSESELRVAVKDFRLEQRQISKLIRQVQRGTEDTSTGITNDNVGFYKLLEDLSHKRSPYIMGFQNVVDGVNRFLSRTFVPLALTSGGWALRVSASETILNTLRNGFWPTFDARIMSSIAKHEKYGYELIEDGRVSESRFIRDVVAGALVGIEKNLVRGMDQGKRDRMLDDFVGTIMRHNGHLPGGIHGTDEGVFNDRTLEKSLSATVLGRDEKGNLIFSDTHKTNRISADLPGQPSHPESLRATIKRISDDPLLQPVAQRMESIFYNRGLEKLTVGGKLIPGPIDRLTGDRQRLEIISNGIKDYKTPEKVEELRKQLEASALREINKMPPEERARFERDVARVSSLSKFSRSNAHEEWAAVIAEHVIKSVSGKNQYEVVFHPSLIMQAVNSERIKPLRQFEGEVFAMRSTAPTNIPALHGHSALMDGSKSNLIAKVADLGHEKVLGPIVNKIAREPLFLLEQHNQMELLRDLVNGNFIDESTAHALADERAFINMMKYVHNPKDKTIWETNMRVLAPFYFAQNQAWRRAFRVMRDNPGAFEKYLKLCLGVTNYISKASAGGAYPSVFIPGTQWMGNVGVLGSRTYGIEGSTESEGFFNSLGFGLSADPGSLSSVFPTGSESGTAGALGLLRPAWGPVVTMPVKIIEKILSGSGPHSLAMKAFAGLLGPISQNSSLYSDFFPSTIGRNVLDASIALANAAGISDITTSAMVSTENLVINNAVDNLYAQQYDKVRSGTNFSGTNPNTGGVWTNDEIVQYCRAQADLAVSSFFNDPNKTQQFLDHAHAAAVMMFVVKGLVSFASPVALSLQQSFSGDPVFQKIASEIDPTTNQPISFNEASAKFALQDPTHVLDLVARSTPTWSNYPETEQTSAMLTNHPEVVRKYPYASAYTITRNGKYSPQAYTLEMSMNLRMKDTPQEYLNALLVAAGNDYYYNYLSTSPVFGGDGVNPGNNTTYAQYSELKSAALSYGRQSNAVWLAEFTGATKYNTEIKAFNQMNQLLDDKTVPGSFLSNENRQLFKWVISQYNAAVEEYQQFKLAKESTYATAVANNWYNWCLQAAADPALKQQSYFITSVLRNMPTK